MGLIAKTEFTVLSGLRDAWAWQAQKIDRLTRQMLDLRAGYNPSPSLLHKLTGMMQQIAFFRAKERQILDEISEMEQKHRFMRKHKKLKRAEPKPLYQAANDDRYERAEEPKKDEPWLIAAILALMSDSDKSSRNHRLTPE